MTDRGSQFTGKLFRQVVKILNIKHLKTTTYHPQRNGAVERLNGTLKQGLTKYIASATTWVDALPLLIYHLRQSERASLGISQYLLVYGREGISLLYLVYASMTEKTYERLSDYAMGRPDTLSSMREIAADRSSLAQESRKKLYEKTPLRDH